MITITIFFLLLKHYVVRQWCISWKLWQISNREIKLEVFPALHIFRSVLKNHCFVLFCHKIAQNTPGFSVGFWCWPTVYDEYILLKFVVDYFCHFECQFLHILFSWQSFCCFFMFFTKEYINFAYLNEKSAWFSSEICFGYFEQIWKDFSDYQVKTN